MKFQVEGMTCSHCERAITRAIDRLGGLARVDVGGGTVEVEGVSDLAAVTRAIEEEGYKVVGSFEAGASATEGGKTCCGTCHA
jgi:copper chaperone